MNDLYNIVLKGDKLAANFESQYVFATVLASKVKGLSSASLEDNQIL